MAELSDAVPKDIFGPMFKHVKEEIAATDWKDLQKNRPKHIAGLCMFIWDEMVDRKAVDNPFKIAPIVNNSFKGIAKFIEAELGTPPVTEAYAASLVRCWPSDIHIADIEFSDNRKPIGKGKKSKGSAERCAPSAKPLRGEIYTVGGHFDVSAHSLKSPQFLA